MSISATALTGKKPLVQKVAFSLGLIFALIGLLGFLPGVTRTNGDGMPYLLGIFMVSVLHNLVHLISGVFGIIASRKVAWSVLYLRAVGIIYAVVTLLGFATGHILGIMHVNIWDNILHLVLAVIGISFGFFARPRATEVTNAA